MADRGRDLKISILSDADKFDLSQPARELQDMADASQDAGRAVDSMGDDLKSAGRDADRLASDVQDASRKVDFLGTDAKSTGKDLDRMGADAKGAGKDLDKLAADAKGAAAKVDASFDQIAKASKTKISQPMEREAHRASESVSEFKDEAKQNLSEVASSFQGDMTSAVDLVQGTLGGLASSLGPVGAAIGAAGAVGVGFIAAQMQKAKEQAKELFDGIVAGKGKLDEAFIDSKLQDMVDDLPKLKRLADDAGVSFRDLARAAAGDPTAYRRVTSELDRLALSADKTAEVLDDGTVVYQKQYGSILLAKEAIGATADATSDAAKKYQLYAAATEDATAAAEAQQKAEEAKAAALDETRSLVEQAGTALDAYNQVSQANADAEQARAQAVADGTKDSKDKWEDYAKAVPASIEQVNAALEKQVQDTANWSNNLRTLARKGVDEGVLAELARLGPEGGPLVAKLANASKPELDKYVSLSKQKGKQGTDGFIQSLLDGVPGVADAAARQKQAVIAAIGGDIPVNVVFRGDAVDFYRTLEDVRRAAATGVNVQAKYAAMERTVP